MEIVRARINEGPLSGPVPSFPRDGAGAVVCFEGIVRPLEDGRAIRGLCYEAYEPMAREMLMAIGEEIACRHGLAGLCVEHSKGLVRVGECSLRLQIAGRHRYEALAAMGEFIDRLKMDVPIWKTAVE
jgi:molybdopterin synthase catalytic subunit